MTRVLYPAPGQVILYVTVSSRRNNRIFTTQEVGTKAVLNVARQYRDKDILLRARLNAIYRHMNKGGGSDAVTNVTDFEFRYYDDFIRRKRVFRFDGRTGKKEFWSEARRKSDGKLVGRRKWRKAGDDL